MSQAINDVEMLYLQNDDTVISVPCADLAPHQIDGLRFLFVQHKKGIPGVILNCPAGCGTTVQVVLFISAIVRCLERPVLILYKTEHEREIWLKQLVKWTTINYDTIAVDTPNAYLRKQVFIKNEAELSEAFCSRHWSLLVVKCDDNNKFIVKLPFRVDFKIWITKQDMRKDQPFLRTLYNWIHPSGIDINKYLDHTADSKEALTRRLLLNSLLEDFLFTRRNMRPFSADKRKLEPEDIPKVTKKNKDATGKKIKRSKKPQEVSTTETVNDSVTTPVNDNLNLSNLTTDFHVDDLSNSKDASQHGNNSKHNTNSKGIDSNQCLVNLNTKENLAQNYSDESKMDVESFIRDNGPLEYNENVSASIKNQSTENTSQPGVSNSPKGDVYTEGSLNFESALADIVSWENQEVTYTLIDTIHDNIHVDSACDSQNKANGGKIQEASEPIEVKNEDPAVSKQSDNCTQIQNVSDKKVSVRAEFNNCETSKVAVSKTEAESMAAVSKTELESMAVARETDTDSITAVIITEAGSLTTASMTHAESISAERKTEADSTDAAIKSEAKTMATASSGQDDCKTTANKAESMVPEIKIEADPTAQEIKTEDKSIASKGQEDQCKFVKSVKKETDSNFDIKMKEFEERALKKFKGSFLDSIF